MALACARLRAHQWRNTCASRSLTWPASSRTTHACASCWMTLISSSTSCCSVMLFRRFSGAGTEALYEIAVHARAAMFQAGPQFLFHRTRRNAKARGDIAMRQLIDAGRDDDGAAAFRQLLQSPLQLLEFGTRAEAARRVGQFIGHLI